MYVSKFGEENASIEEICFTKEHIDKVLLELEKNLKILYEKYIETENNTVVTNDKLNELAKAFGTTVKSSSKPKDIKKVIEKLLSESEREFEHDRDKYLELLDLEAMKEYKDDLPSFKNTVLKKDCPIIRKTLKNLTAKELDKYREAFHRSQPNELYEVLNNILFQANSINDNWYIPTVFDSSIEVIDLPHNKFDEEGYTAYGVIGGGIKSHFLFKLYPHLFPNRSREAIYALWYLTSKKVIDTKQDSEFLMINQDKVITQQNYFYPYGLFSFYAIYIYKWLDNQFQKYNIRINRDKIFVPVDSFLSFITRNHQDEIDLLKRQAQEYTHEH